MSDHSKYKTTECSVLRIVNSNTTFSFLLSLSFLHFLFYSRVPIRKWPETEMETAKATVRK